MRILLLLTATFMMLVSFQNCSPEHSGTDLSSQKVFKIDSVYPYATKSTYYDNVQLVNVQSVSGGYNYQFIASLVYVDAPDTQVKLRLTFKEESGALVCPRVEVTVNRSNNNVEVSNCTSTKSQSTILITVEAKLTTETNYTEVGSYRFDI